MSRFKNNDSRIIPYTVARGEPLLQDLVFAPETIRRGLQILELDYGAGRLAYTPEMIHEFETVLQRRYDVDDGPYVFEMPSSAIYDDPDLAAFYGVTTSTYNEFLRPERESFQETTDRLIRATAKEVADHIPGLAQLHENFYNESWARHGVADENPHNHNDPDTTLFRNSRHENWNTMARPLSTGEKRNIVDTTSTVGFNIYAQPNEGWQIDRPGGFWDSLPPVPPARGF